MPNEAATAGVPVDAEAKPARKKPPTKKKKPAKKKTAKDLRESTGRTEKPTKIRAAELAKEIEIVRRRDKILDLKENGASIRQISDLLIRDRVRELIVLNPLMPENVAEFEAAKGLSPTRIHQLLMEALDDLHKNQRLKVEQHVALELRKLERAELAIFGNMQRIGDLDKNLLRALMDATKTHDIASLLAIAKHGFYSDDIEKYTRSLERIWKRRDTLLGLNKPIKVEHAGEGGGPIETVTRVILPPGADAPVESNI